jgi:hypothetical protein
MQRKTYILRPDPIFPAIETFSTYSSGGMNYFMAGDAE